MDLHEIRALNASDAFNRWCGVEVESGESGMVQITLPWRPEFACPSGHLHAGLIGAFVDTAAGLAAWTLVGPVLASHFSIDCLRSPVADRFIVKAKVIRAEGSALVIACDVFASSSGEADVHLATGEVTATVVSPTR
jgi:acyl-coenzyme A thioesterase PaaI-like protein